MKNKIRLIKNIAALILIGIIGYAVYDFFKSGSEESYSIEDTPLQVEMVRSIAEISTISYKDEIVQDTIEYYKGTGEILTGNLSKMADLDYWKYGVRASNVKRRLTLIIRGEVKYGFDLTKNPIDIQHNKDTIWVNLPKPQILDVLIVPSATEVFQENGEWEDKATRTLEKKAIQNLRSSAKKLELDKKAMKQMEKLLRSIMPKGRTLLIYFNE